MFEAIIGAAGSLLGGLFGSNSQKKQMQQQIAAQKEFAQKGIRWKVADAKAAGVHPLYALGAQTNAFAPIGIYGDPMAEGISQAGQHISRAVSAKQSVTERMYNQKVMELQLQRGELENTLLASQIARMNQPAQPPPLPMGSMDRFLVDGQGQTALMDKSGLVEDLAQTRTVSDPAAQYQEPGAVTDRSLTRTSAGGLAPVYSKDAKERLEDDFLGMLAWNIRNRLMPSLSAEYAKPPYQAPAGHHWVYDVINQQYVLKRHDYSN